MTVARRRLDRPATAAGARSSEAAPAARPPRRGPRRAPTGAGLPDDRLGLLFACAHPALEAAIRAPLMLQVVLGLDAAAHRLGLPRVAGGDGQAPGAGEDQDPRGRHPVRDPRARRARRPRLDAVLEAIYAAFAEGWTDPDGHRRRPPRPDRRGALPRAAASRGLLPEEPEALGLLALMLHAQARRPARRDADGDYVPLGWQDPGLWDAPMIAEAEALLIRASTMGAIGRFQLEAALQSAHVHRCRTGVVRLAARRRSSTTRCSRLGLAGGRDQPRARARRAATAPPAGSLALDAVAADPRLADYQPYWAARAELLARAGAVEAAGEAYDARDRPRTRSGGADLPAELPRRAGRLGRRVRAS